MTTIRETIARAILYDLDEHSPAYVGFDIDKMDEARVDGDCNFLSAADAVLRALDEAGCVVVATDAASEARRGMEWFERTFGVPLGDMPGRQDVERVRAMISASVVE